MRRIRDAFRALRGTLPEEYVRWRDVPNLQAQLAELEAAVAGTYEKLNMMAARQRKREQRAAEAAALEDAPGQANGEQLDLQVSGDRKAALRQRAALMRAGAGNLRMGSGAQ